MSAQPDPAWDPRIVVFACNWCSYAGADTAGDKLHQRRVVDDQVIACCRIPTVQPSGPLHLEIGVFGNDAHALGWASR